MSSESAADLGQLLTSDAAPILSPVCAEEHLREQLQALQAQLDHLNELKQKAVEMNNAEIIRPPLARVIVASFDLPQAEQAILGQPLEYLESFKQHNDFGDDSSSSHSGDSSAGAGSPREEYLYLMNYLKNSEDFDYVWVGGLDVRKFEVFDIRAIQQHLMDVYNCVPVFGNDQTFDDHYNGFCKAVLWPLLHGIPPVSIYSIADKRTSVEKAWNAFLKVNEAFAQQILQFYNPATDVIWVHDYHLFLLPFIIRQQLPDAVIGFYLHTCFPSSEIFRILPYRHQILQGILSSDTVFVQTPDDKRHLMTSCMKVLNTTKTEEGVQTENGHFTNIKVNPVGVDLELIEHLNRDISLVKRRDMLLKQTKSHTIIISVDEMDYVKGISHKLSAYEQFLESWPEYRDKVVLVQVVFPVRSESDEYHVLQSQVNEQVGRINSKYGTVDYLPIHYVNRHVDKAELLAMFSLAKVCLITPLKDGMNVLPLQFLACQDPKDPGSLIISEFAGCSSVVTEARVINPWATQQFAEAIHEAICEDKPARVERHQVLRKCLEDHTTFAWTNEVLSDLLSTLQRSQDNEAFVARNH